ncbi:hypothetical protein POJ06DRAFT_290410 [Lipomyces tetrasporus]|uniref:Transposase n=3 Tax=Lipomyces TaxID=29828 RepID=A0AAD7QSA8_9ASCO|nr:uncharacterized protein POJ06DRAFT_290410 [Lipomyces tetrasporus]KAJ8100543.1 hypothetical protein POJ06DRAFT_290410 [Lipomyces tetrasporus]
MSAQTTGQTTSTGNAQTSVRGSRKRKLSSTFSRASNDIAENFWRESTRELSQKWALNTTTVSAGVSGSQRSIPSNSWFSIQVHPQKRTRPPNSQKTFLLSSITSPQKTMADEQQRTEGGGNNMRARKIRLFPTRSQKEILRQWFGAQRYIYNKCASLKELRAVLLNSETNTLNDNEKWLDEYRSNMAKYEKNKEDKKKFALKFRSKKAPIQSLSVLKKKWNCGTFYSSILSSALPSILARDSRLLRTRLGRYFLIIPSDGEAKTKSATRGDFVLIDPGVRTFLTCYDSNENVVEVGRCAVVRVSKLLHHRRKLQSRQAALRNHKKRQNLRKAYLRLGERINHLVEDMHKKTATFLCANYDNIFLPKLNFHTCRKLNRKSKACMATLAHCAFFDRTAMKAEQFEQTQVVEVKEEWTSKTCSCCGWVNHTLGRSKVFECQRCTSVFDRDFNASKTIILKYFTERMMSSGSVSWGPSPAVQ